MANHNTFVTLWVHIVIGEHMPGKRFVPPLCNSNHQQYLGLHLRKPMQPSMLNPAECLLGF